MLSPLARFHGTTPREPWHFGEGAVRAVRRLIRLRESLIPYMIESYKKLTDAGLPLARTLVMDYPDDPATWDTATEYLFGTSLLVAPVLEEGAAGRSVYLPAGTWRRFGEKGNIKKGPVWVEASSRAGAPIIYELIK
jgi:alpha-D-xyloside xylohydrolase